MQDCVPNAVDTAKMRDLQMGAPVLMLQIIRYNNFFT